MAFIQLVSEEGISFNVNKYFLQLYDEFFYNLVEDHLNNDIVIHFQDETNVGIEKLVNSVNWKHLSCDEHKLDNSMRIIPEEHFEPKINPISEVVFDNNNQTNEISEGDLKPNEDILDNTSYDEEGIIEGIIVSNKVKVKNKKKYKKQKLKKEKLDNTNDDKENKSASEYQELTEDESNKVNVKNKKKYEKRKLKTEKLDNTNGDKENKSASEYQELTDDEFFQCPFEDDYYTSIIPDEMYAHISMHHKIDQKVHYRVPAIRFLLKTLAKKISKKCFLCKHKTFEFKDRQKLREHYQHSHAPNREYEICSHCDKKMLKTSLKWHLKELNAEKRLSCEICGQMYKRLQHLNRHRKDAHDKEAVECPQCKKVFYWNEEKKERLLKEHIHSVHEKNKPFACDICGKKMSKYSNLDDHRQKVHGAKKLSIGSYREMIKSGNYKFLVNVPTNIDYSGLIIKNWPNGNSHDETGQEPNKVGHEINKDVQELKKEIQELDKDVQELEKEGQEHNKGDWTVDKGKIEYDKGDQDLDKGGQELGKGDQELDRGIKEFDKGGSGQ